MDDIGVEGGGPRELVIRTPGRATTLTYAGDTDAATLLREQLANPNSPAPRRITTQPDHLDGYLGADALTRLEVEPGLRRDSLGTITLRGRRHSPCDMAAVPE